MPVERFRSIEASGLREPTSPGGGNLIAAFELSELCLRLKPTAPPRGVRRFASIEAAQEHRRRWETQSAK